MFNSQFSIKFQFSNIQLIDNYYQTMSLRVPSLHRDVAIPLPIRLILLQSKLVIPNPPLNGVRNLKQAIVRSLVF